MTSLHTRLRDYLAGPGTAQLAQVAPLSFVAGCTGAIIAALVGMPGFAASGLGIVLGGLAINFSSSLIDRILLADSDRQRSQVIEQGVRDGDRDVQALVAGALIQAGAEMSQAIPAADRDALIGDLHTGMQQAGGSVATIAPRYTAALRDPQTDWAALQAALRETITHVHQTMEASEEGVISGSRQEASQASGPVEQVMRATKKGRIENSQQIASGPGATTSRHCPDCGLAVPTGQPVCASCGARLM